MRLFALTALVMIAFAANSLLNRAAVGAGEIGALPFALVRVVSGALILALLTRARPNRANLGPALALTLYLVGFSLAYLALDAGLGALILFAGVQVTMLTGAIVMGETPSPRRLAGAGVALAGLVILLWPTSASAPPLGASLLMGAAALGWGLYSLAGKRAAAPLQATAANFMLATPLVALVALAFGWGAAISPYGMTLAVLSGVVTSGLGYALWYGVLPMLGASRAAVAQLSVPVIAILGGVVLLGESLGLMTALASAIVMIGVALAMMPGKAVR